MLTAFLKTAPSAVFTIIQLLAPSPQSQSRPQSQHTLQHTLQSTIISGFNQTSIEYKQTWIAKHVLFFSLEADKLMLFRWSPKILDWEPFRNSPKILNVESYLDRYNPKILN